MPDPGFMLGFYQDPTAVGATLRSLRRKGFRRAAAIGKSPDGRVRIDNSTIAPPKGALLGAGMGLILGFLLDLPPLTMTPATFACAVFGWLLAWRFDGSLDERLLIRYKRWVLAGETLLIVQVMPRDMGRVMEILRRTGGAVATFAFQPARTPDRTPDDEPLRMDPLSPERLSSHATRIAGDHEVGRTRRRIQPLSPRLQKDRRVLEYVRHALSVAVKVQEGLTAGAEWLLDNAYLIQGQIAEIQRNLPLDYYRGLPLIASGPLTGLPRVHSIALELVTHLDGRLDQESIVAFLHAYQRVSPLTIGELWATPLMLKMALIESLRRLSMRVYLRQRLHEQADFWANRLLYASRHDPDQLLFILAELARENPHPSPSFAVRIVGHVHDEAAALVPLQDWLERKLDAPLPEILQHEQARQAADQVSIANAVNSLRLFARLQWREVFAEVSLVERTLRADPAGVYLRMDFATRDLYRHEIEEVSRWSTVSELAVAGLAIDLARGHAGDARKGHVGYYLVDAGRQELTARFNCRPPLARRVLSCILRHPAPFFLGSIIMQTGVLLAAVLAAAARAGAGVLLLTFLAPLALFPASELAVQITNRLVTRFLPPRVLPSMSFAEGLPEHCRTLVVVPMMLLSPGAIKGEVDRLEARYLGNADPNLFFALLADFSDASTPVTPADEALLRMAVEGIEGLNEKYGKDRFFLFCRQRRWCESEQCWIGWERKRGKLEELNRFLMGAGDPADGMLRVGAAEALRGIKYVITLDADTILPRDSALHLVEILAHPLNQAQLTADGRSVRAGYTIIQPRVCTSLPSADATPFSRLYADPTGMDPYCHAISDVYQDLAGEGTFYGKGIYDVEAFHSVLSGRFPEATILSHDLLEGAYVRTGLASQIELLDLFPGTYQAYVRRQHRWIRGDWQIAPWALPRVGGAPNPISLLNRWKIVDNLRRSLVPLASAVLLAVCWVAAPLPALWSSLVGGALLFTPLISLMAGVGSCLRGSTQAWREIRACAYRGVISLALLPHQAGVALDAIARVWYRRLISHRRLLEWETAQMTHIRCRSGANSLVFLAQIVIYALAASLLAAGIASLRPASAPAVLPFLVLWGASPLIAWRLNTVPRRTGRHKLSARDRLLLRRIARRTWRYFDDFVNEDSNWLPPDNYQEALNIEIAQRTSPTNIGMWFLSALAAHDFGYLTLAQLAGRIDLTMATLAKLEMFEGHLLNWYDTRTLAPLRPQYVSTVDSGNFLACLWTLAQGLAQVGAEPLCGPRALAGLGDTLANLRQTLVLDETDPSQRNAIASLVKLCAGPPENAAGLVQALRQAAAPVHALARSLRAGGAEAPERFYWPDKLVAELDAWTALIETYLPWLDMLARLPEERLAPLGREAVDLRRQALAVAPSLTALAREAHPALRLARWLRGRGGELAPALAAWLDEFEEACAKATEAAQALWTLVKSLIGRVKRLADGMGMRFLYDPARRLFPIGYNVTDRHLDTSYYDLLASEARLASFVAIGRGDVPVEHWGALGRPFGANGRSVMLLSWNGTMFEYLMPLLLTKAFRESLLARACWMAVRSQIAYAARRGIPWGVSEAAFSALDTHQTYQYRAFGVPWLGLKRGLEEDLVVAPYATALALAVDPSAAARNLRRLAGLGLYGRYGYFESIDYTRQHRPEGERGVVVYAYMAHHQGMSLIAIDNALHREVMQDRFHADPRVRATEPLLFERTPADPPLTRTPGVEGPAPRLAPIVSTRIRNRSASPNTPSPTTHLLSNRSLTVLVTNAGGGQTRWRDLDVTRWRADTTRDAWGSFIYLRDLDEGTVWSTTYQPSGHTGRCYDANFTVDRAEFRRRDFGLDCLTEIVVSPEDDAEIRRVTLVNCSSQTRRVELTSFAELALAPHGEDRAHPAFSKLFIETGALPDRRALIAWRRRRSPEEPQIWSGHVVASDAAPDGPLEYETDRWRFLGRHGTAGNPAAMKGSLTNTTGAVLDPIFSLRLRFTVEPGRRVRVAFTTVAADTHLGVRALVDKYGEFTAVQSAVEKAWTHAQLELRHLGIQTEDARRFQELGSHVIYPNPKLRPAGGRLRRSTLGQARLWAYGISGDLPILTVTINEAREINFVREVLLAHAYLRIKGLKMDLVILNGEAVAYGQPLHEELRRLIAAHSMYTGTDQPGGVFLRAIAQMPEEDVTLLQSAARAALVAARGTLAQQLAAPVEIADLPPRLKPNRRIAEEPSAPLPFLELPYFNGLGGFTADGREYAIYLGPDAKTPAPWVNVMATPEFGALVSESGQGFAWYGNSQTNRLTPWSNDPVSDPAGDALYLRDEETGVYWSPTPLPIREQDAYRARHGQGYTVFEHNSHAIEQELTVFVPANGDPVRIQRLRLRNRSSRPRRLSVIAYADWTLGTDREETQLHVVAKWDAQAQALLARNAYHPDFGGRFAFAALSPAAESYTADRTEFIGRNGSPARPAALERRYLSGRTGAGLDACAAQQVTVAIEPGRTAEVTILLGQSPGIEQVRQLVRHYRDPAHVEEALVSTRAWWDDLLGRVQVRTPHLALDFLLNRWLLYQTLSCRIWARSAFYQSGGAYGFRDQLQDVLALVHAAPELARAQILKAAGRQFPEGDVQHWWHPPGGNGTRTRCGDDLLWLPYATAHYVRVTGDLGILNERAPFLEGRALEDKELDAYMTPSVSMEDATLYEHCRRALAKGLTAGPHGLPLIGSGDWNDGLNRVGAAGQGESVWLAWFLLDVLRSFAALSDRYGETEAGRADRERASALARRIEAQAWDGEWYRRAFYDDGTPLGSETNTEARIDSLPQSWAAIAAGDNPERIETALAAAERHLVRWDDGLVALFSPPFDQTARDPGYIRGYPPGVRENGGQYTHAAIWLAMAYARRGEGDKAGAIMRLLNPVEHARNPAELERYRVEPYVISADVYALPGRVGQGGWSWYTGSSGWMYRVWLEEMLGFKREGDRLTIDPVIPSDWGEYTITYRHGDTVYEILVENPDGVSHGVARIELDGETRPGPDVLLTDDGGRHQIRVLLGADRAARGLPGPEAGRS